MQLMRKWSSSRDYTVNLDVKSSNTLLQEKYHMTPNENIALCLTSPSIQGYHDRVGRIIIPFEIHSLSLSPFRHTNIEYISPVSNGDEQLYGSVTVGRKKKGIFLSSVLECEEHYHRRESHSIKESVVRSLDWSSSEDKISLSHEVTSAENSKVDCCSQHTFVIKLEGRRKALSTSNSTRSVCWTLRGRNLLLHLWSTSSRSSLLSQHHLNTIVSL